MPTVTTRLYLATHLSNYNGYKLRKRILSPLDVYDFTERRRFLIRYTRLGPCPWRRYLSFSAAVHIPIVGRSVDLHRFPP